LRIKPYIIMTRPLNSSMTGLGIVFALTLYSGWKPSPTSLIIGFATGFLGSSAAMLINDYLDREVDKINKPWKPLPSGEADPNATMILSLTLLAIAIGINIYINTPALLTALVYGLASYIYSYLRRAWWSQLIVAFSTTAPVIYGYFASNTPREYMWFTLLYSTTIFLASIAREVVKAIQDMEGDKLHNYQTIPLKYGVETARKTILATGSAAIALAYVAGVVGEASLIYMILITMTNIIYINQIREAYIKTWDKKTLERCRRNMLKAMMMGLIAFLFAKTP